MHFKKSQRLITKQTSSHRMRFKKQNKISLYTKNKIKVMQCCLNLIVGEIYIPQRTCFVEMISSTCLMTIACYAISYIHYIKNRSSKKKT